MINMKNGSGASPSVGDVRPRETKLALGALSGRSTHGTESRVRRIVVAGLLAAVLATAPTLSFAEGKAAEVSKESGLGAAAAVSSLIYGPAKLLYATGGVIVGAFAYAFTAGDSAVAEKVFTRSLRGDYVITPGMLMGEESLEFIGRDIAETTAPAASAGSICRATTKLGASSRVGSIRSGSPRPAR